MWLDSRRRQLDPWIDVADRINRGEMDKNPKCVLQSLYIGLRRSRQPECIEAVKRLKSHKDFVNVPWQKLEEDPRKGRR
jgi:hypothetical protein